MLLFLKEKKKPIILVFLIFFHFLLISLQIPLGDEESYFEKAIFSIFSPVQHGIIIFFREIGDLWNNYFYLLEVQKLNNRMKAEISSLRQENNQLKNALQELKARKDIQEFISTIHESFLITRVIGIDANNVYKSITVDKGSLDGIEKDMTVVDKKGNLVGRIVNPISLKEARIQLITDNESGVGVISQEKKAVGVLTGDAEGNCFLKYIYPTQEVLVGEELVTSGLDLIFSSGIKVGTISSITTDVTLFKKIKVKPAFRFNDLDFVVVIPRDFREIF